MAANDGVTKNSTAHRFEVDGTDGLAVLNYHENDNHITLIHTEVAPALEGKGYGSRLARAALDYARENNLRVIVHCPFVTTYLERHPEYSDLVGRR